MEELDKLKDNDKPTLIKFEAEWCQPCKQYKPIFDEISERFKDQINTITIDVEEEVEVAQKNAVMSVPTTILMVDGEIKEREMGILQKQELIELLGDHVI